MRFRPIVAAAKRDGMAVRAYLSTVVFCPYEGRIAPTQVRDVMERLLEAISFEASDRFGTELVIDGAYVDSSLGKLAQDEDLARYIL